MGGNTVSITITIVIPAYLEEENLRILLPRIKKEMEAQKDSYEILIIDTMIPLDNTKRVCIENNIHYICREQSNSYGDAVRTGIRYAQGEYIIFMDADGSHSPEFIPNLLKYKNEYDVVIASRYIEGGATDNNKILIIMSFIVNSMYSLILHLQCKDVSNSFKLYKADLLKTVSLSCHNFDIVEEILFKLKKYNKNLKIKEVPFSFKQRMFGKTKRNLFIFMLTYLFTLIKLRCNTKNTTL